MTSMPTAVALEEALLSTWTRASGGRGYARSGSGNAYVTAETNCFPPGPAPVPPSPPVPVPCSPYKTVDRSGFLYPGQAAVYGYYIPPEEITDRVVFVRFRQWFNADYRLVNGRAGL